MSAAEKKLVFSSGQIQEKVRELARTISQDYQDKEPILIGILNGVFMFFADLVRNLDVPVRIDFIRLASYGCESRSNGNVSMVKDVELDISGRDVIVVEDIVDSGHTLAFLRDHLKGKNCRSVRMCVLIDKHERREQKIDVDYLGFQVQQGFLVGYGLDFNEQYRYLPDIYHLNL